VNCVNVTLYNDMLTNRSFYIQYIGNLLTASGVNWMFPLRRGYLDIMSFNITYLSEFLTFDMDLLNRTVFNGLMRLCLPPPPSTTPAMSSGNANGWTAGGLAPTRASAAATISVSGLWLLAAGMTWRGVRMNAG